MLVLSSAEPESGEKEVKKRDNKCTASRSHMASMASANSMAGCTLRYDAVIADFQVSSSIHFFTDFIM